MGLKQQVAVGPYEINGFKEEASESSLLFLRTKKPVKDKDFMPRVTKNGWYKISIYRS